MKNFSVEWDSSRAGYWLYFDEDFIFIRGVNEAKTVAALLREWADVLDKRP